MSENINISDAQLGAYVRGLIRASGAVPVGISQRREYLRVRFELVGQTIERDIMFNEIEPMRDPAARGWMDAEEAWHKLEAEAEAPPSLDRTCPTCHGEITIEHDRYQDIGGVLWHSACYPAGDKTRR